MVDGPAPPPAPSPSSRRSSSLVTSLLALRPRIVARPVLAYGIALALTALALAIRVALGRGSAVPLVTFYPSILLAALICGRGPAYAGVLLAWLAAWYFALSPVFAQPIGSAVVATTAAFAFLATALIELVDQLVERLALTRSAFEQREQALRAETEALARRERAHVAALREFEAIYDQSPLGLAYLDAELRYVRINARLAEINGLSIADHLGREVWSLLPDLKESAEAPLRRVLDHGETIANIELTGETPAMPGVRRHWSEMFYPVRDDSGAVVGVGIFCEETTDQLRARERERLLLNEVDHRAKNLLAVIQSIIQLTAAPGNVAEYKEVLVGRIQALGRVHTLLASNRWEGAQLQRIAEAELSAFGSGVTLRGQGPSVKLKPGAAQAIGMILHELATNAAKYGALSDGGRVELSWARVAGDGAAQAGAASPLTLLWRESGGPPVTPPTRTGFGTTLIRASVENQLDGRLRYDLAAAGLECEMTLPASNFEPGIVVV